ncbi:MAG: hypothetical protein V4495_11775 [Pseudomonadota bacterium]
MAQQKNYFHLLNISANVCVYLKYIYDILKNDMGGSLEKTVEKCQWVLARQQRWPHQQAGKDVVFEYVHSL